MSNYQLWESQVKGFLSTMNNDFIILNKEGINFVRLNPDIPRKSFKDKDGEERMVHSLNSIDYLKVDGENMLYFENKLDDNNILLQIQQQHNDAFNNITYENIFQIKLMETSLQELIMIQSLFLLDSANDIHTLIGSQPNKNFFFKSYMELDHSNLVQILSFESRIIKKLLENHDSIGKFKYSYPLFYTMQQNLDNKIHLTTPIQIALESN